MAAYLPSLLSLLNGFILLLLGAVATWWWKQYDARQKAAAETASDKKQWRDGRLAAEKALSEALASERSERVQWQLKREAEGALVAGILEENAEAQKLLASIAATTQAHGGQLTQLNERLNAMQAHVNQLTLLHAK